MPMSSTAARLVSVALSMGFEAITEDILTTRIKHRDKTSVSAQQANAIPISQASYTALETVFVVLSGSIQTMLDRRVGGSNGGR